MYDREHTIGHSFFMSLSQESEIDDLAMIFERQIIPLLEEYFFEDWEKIRIILADNKKPQHLAFITEKYDESMIMELLGDDFNNHTQQRVFERNHDALFEPDAYISIYQSNSGTGTA